MTDKVVLGVGLGRVGIVYLWWDVFKTSESALGLTGLTLSYKKGHDHSLQLLM